MVNTNCSFCNKQIKKKLSQVEMFSNSFCNTKCMGKYNIKGKQVNCYTCNDVVYKSPAALKKSKSGKHFCSPSCSVTYRNTLFSGEKHSNYSTGRFVKYREKALKVFGKKCMGKECPFKKVEEHMLDVHHLDSNRGNNRIENLEVLCVWCHAKLTRKRDC